MKRRGAENRAWSGERRRTTAAESWTTKYVNVVLTPPCTPSAIPMPQTVCCRSFGDYTNEVVQREKCTFRYKAGRARRMPRTELKIGVEERRWKVPLCRDCPGPRAADNIFFAESRRAVEWIFIGAAFEPFKNGIRFYRIRALASEYRRNDRCSF